MHILLVHQNFPGQFRELGPAWLARGWQVSAVGSAAAEQFWQPGWNGLHYFPYHCPPHRWRGEVLAQHLHRLRVEQQLQPQLVIAHSGWGEVPPVREIWPQVPLVVYPELWGSAEALGANFDARHLQIRPADRQAIHHQNLRTARALRCANAAVAPTAFQRNTFPSPWREQLQLIHEGVDCERLQPNPSACLQLPNGLKLDRGQRVISYVSRHFEPLRGLHTFMAALPPLLEAEPTLQVVMVGGAGPGYGPGSLHPEGHLAQALKRLPPSFDASRLHCVGPLPYPQLCALLQLTSAHVYLTYPYTLSWSLLEAMACGAAVVGNHSGPLDEVITSGHNGLLVDFNSAPQLAAALQALLKDPEQRHRLGQAARHTVEQHYSLELALARYERLFDQLLSHTSRWASSN